MYRQTSSEMDPLFFYIPREFNGILYQRTLRWDSPNDTPFSELGTKTEMMIKHFM